MVAKKTINELYFDKSNYIGNKSVYFSISEMEKINKYNQSDKETVIFVKDKELTNAIKKQLNIPIEVNLTIELMEGLEYLDISKESITSLEGLEFATNLKILNMFDLQYFDNDISPLQGLKKITRLNMGNNDIVDIRPLRVSARNLEVLNLENNSRLANVNVLENAVNLEILSLYNTLTMETSFVLNMNKLNTLFIGKTKVNSDVNFTENISQCKHLKTLSISQLGIQRIDFLVALTELVEIDISFNAISDLRPLKEIDNLSYVNAFSQVIELPAMSQLFTYVLPLFGSEGSAPELRWINEGEITQYSQLKWQNKGLNVLHFEIINESFTGAIIQDTYE